MASNQKYVYTGYQTYQAQAPSYAYNTPQNYTVTPQYAGYYYNPGYYYGGTSTGSSGSTSSGSTSTGTTSTPATTTPSTDAITLALATIPIANPGNIITSEYHNALRTAVILLGNRIGVSTTGAAGSITLAPQFTLEGTTASGWSHSNGVAVAPAAGASGFLTLSLPDGARIQSLQIRGRRTGTVASFDVQLLRVDALTGDRVTLVNPPTIPVTDPFDVTQSLSVTGAGPAANEEYRTVDNSKFTYLVIARTGATTTGGTAQINSLRVNYSPI